MWSVHVPAVILAQKGLSWQIVYRKLCQAMANTVRDHDKGWVTVEYANKLAEIAKHEVYSKGLKHPQIRIVNIWDVQLDHEFCRLYKGKQHILDLFPKILIHSNISFHSE